MKKVCLRVTGVLASAFMVMLILLPHTAAAQDSYRIRAGDTLRIEVLEDPALNRSVLVSPDGRITLPLAGAVTARGQSVEQVQAALAAQLAPNFAAPPNVFVGVERLVEPRPAGPAAPPAPPRTIDVFVLGEVGTSGKLAVAPGTTVLQMFAQMGGFSRFAATQRIQLRRTGPDGSEVVYTLNYDAIEDGRSPNGRVTLSDGDVIVVPQRRLFE
jgi:polysaccharide biosynthesis/export protein